MLETNSKRDPVQILILPKSHISLYAEEVKSNCAKQDSRQSQLSVQTYPRTI
jgi:hypothetical protein